MSQSSGHDSPEIGRWPAPMVARSVLLFGGTFDPPHRGHLELAPIARESLAFDWLVYIPARRSPHKIEAPEADDAQRLAMLEAGLTGTPRVGISTIELERSPSAPSFTVDTLREIRQIVGDDVELRLLIGADQAKKFDAWKEPEEIRQVARPAVMVREGGEALDDETWGPDVVEVPTLEISATEIRRLLGEGPREPGDLTPMVPERVLDVIKRERLYQGER